MKKTFTLLLTTLCLSSFAQVDLDKDLEAYYPFNGNANDESTNSNDGTVNGPTLTTDRFSNSNSAYNFTSDDNIIFPLIFNGSTDYTISLWVKSSRVTAGGAIISNGNDDGFGIVEQGDIVCTGSNGSGKLEVIFPGKSCDVLNSTFKLTKDAWTHLCLVKSSNNLNLYVNGALKESATITSPTPPTTETSLGKTKTLGFGGDIDDVRLYSRAVTSDEIDALYEDKSTSSVYSVNIAAQTSVYPNPSNGTFNVELPKQGANLTLVNAQGVTVKQFNNFSGTKLQVANLPKGMYILQTELDGYTAYKKLIVQ